MTYTKINQDHINQLKQFIDEEDVFLDNDNLKKYGKDETEDLVYKPEIVLKPKNVLQISEIMKLIIT